VLAEGGSADAGAVASGTCAARTQRIDAVAEAAATVEAWDVTLVSERQPL
jgi:hypothetical protein